MQINALPKRSAPLARETATVRPASARSLTTQAFELLRHDILTSRLRPGERLRIQNLSDQYQIGTTAIREALSRLVTDGMVESEDQRGFCVAPVSRDELLDLTQTRIDIESLALKAAIAKGSLEWESRLLSAFHLLSKTPPPVTPALHGEWARIHRQFHEVLLDGCGSPWLLRLCSILYDKTERYRNLAEQHTRPENRNTIAEHQQMMSAAMARDAQEAVRLLSAHFWETTEIILSAAPQNL